MNDVLIVGGGVIGLSIAYELSGQGVSVEIVERGDFGMESSWAGAGMLLPGQSLDDSQPDARLRAISNSLWPEWSEQLRETTGIDNGFRRCGGLQVRLEGSPSALDENIAFWKSDGATVHRLASAEVKSIEPNVADTVAAYRLPELAQVRNPLHMKALVAACADRAVKLTDHTPVTGFKNDGQRITAVKTNGGTIGAGRFCVASGAWSRQLLEPIGCKIKVKPVRGQIVQLFELPLPFTHVIQCGSRYLVPRPTGHILVGSTEEDVGFEKANTVEATSRLLDFAHSIMPCLAKAKFQQAWAGLRPGSPRRLPFLGPVPDYSNLFVATGHFRGGLHLSSATGLLMRQLLLDQQTLMPLDAFSADPNFVPTAIRVVSS
jgi:glycine oxidase